MDSTVNEIIQFALESDVKFVRLGFCDIFGVQKNISIMADRLKDVFTDGVSFDAQAIRGFADTTNSDLLLYPDPVTLRVLPWRPGPGRVVRFYCDIQNPDGSPFAQDTRLILQRVLEHCAALSLTPKVGVECEFYLFKTDEEGEPTNQTLDHGGYLDISPLDKGEDIRREVCLTLEEMGIAPETSHHERGPGQNEVDFRFSDALGCVDDFQTFKSVVKSIATRNGLFASFLPKPIANMPGSGLHINLSLGFGGQNLFSNLDANGPSTAGSFVAGVLDHASEMTLFLNQLGNSYERLGEHGAPKYVSWSHQNHSQLIRVLAVGNEQARMELRSPDPACNPYLAFALIIAAGLDGIERSLDLPPAVNTDLQLTEAAANSNLALLPDSLETAITLAKHSDFVRSVLGDELFERFIALKEAESGEYTYAANNARYFEDYNFKVV